MSELTKLAMKNLKKSKPLFMIVTLLQLVSIEAQRDPLIQSLVSAQRRIREFASNHGWESHTRKHFIQKAMIFDNQNDFIDALLQVTGSNPSADLPVTVSAALENGIFMSVSPDEYRRIYPEGDGPDAFEKLIAHEIAHRLHIRILNGDENAMGPIWLFEGFALYAAGQFPTETLPEEEILSIIRSTHRGSYRKYSAVFRFCLAKIPLETLVHRAGSPDFIDWLLPRIMHRGLSE
jgi:hypothetical protein